eukprot:6474328-Amphidinium_carterae.1
MKEKSGSITLAPGVHGIMMTFWERLGGAGMKFSYDGPDTGDVKMIAPGTVLTRDAPTTTTTTPGGLNAAFFYVPDMKDDADRMPDIEGKTPDVTRIDPTVDYATRSGEPWEGLEEDERFAARWTGAVEIKTGGDYTFYINSDDGSLFTIDGIRLIDNDYPHGMVEKSGTIALTPGLHSIMLEFWERLGGAGMIFSYLGADTHDVKDVVPNSALFTTGPTTTTTPPPGLLAEYFYDVGIESGSTRMPDLAGKSPDVTRIDPQVNYPSVSNSPWSGLAEHEEFAARWTGGVKIAQGGAYTFQIDSDDGSLFAIDGISLIDNDYPHGMVKATGIMQNLNPGTHNVELLFWERHGGA